MDFDICWSLREPLAEYDIQCYSKKHKLNYDNNLELRKLIIEVLKYHTGLLGNEDYWSDSEKAIHDDAYQKGYDDAEEHFEDSRDDDLEEAREEGYTKGRTEGYEAGFKAGQDAFALEE
jgi:flagellar biosynthesis/type III secretory pathway protein FliH